MAIRKAALIIDSNSAISNQISVELRQQGYHSICVEETETFLPLLDSMDRIYTIVYVDQNGSPETLKEHIRVLNLLGAGVPLVFTTANNELQKEKEVRKAGVFFYHVKGDGMNGLIHAIVRAMEYGIMKDTFIAGFDDQ